ncbi:putative sulfate exporter family transporter, partial [Arenibaculum sp.]|uniref:putative sulfate exporter family transporter n=1 Tax=Arenibaculum sp. TaxID=2865862 RepID=UPI002E1345C1|nr:putative sulfate exporter family transporter [Arenibaculum sp.]
VVAVTTLSTLAMIAYPWIALSFGLSDREVGIFLGGAIHDVAQVVGAGYSVSTEAGDVATVTKLLRVALLAPIALLLAAAFSTGVKGRSLRMVPPFLVGFAALVLLTSAGAVPDGVRTALSAAAAWCLTTAMVAFGIRTTIGGLLAVGPRAAILVVAETVLLASWLLVWMGFPGP